MNELQTPVMAFGGVRGYVGENGIAMLNAEDVARGWGFTELKDGKEYIRWRTVNGYLREFGFSQDVAKDNFLPENMVYRLGFKASNETAQKFQAKLADEILPSIRKHGAYMTEQTLEQALTSPDFLIKLATELKTEKEARLKLEGEVLGLNETIAEMKPKADYVDTILSSKELMPITFIAKDYGVSAQELNKVLHELGVQYKIGNRWVLYAKYQGFGYVSTKQHIEASKKAGKPIESTEWTQKGRLFLYAFLKKKRNLVPMIEREDEANDKV